MSAKSGVALNEQAASSAGKIAAVTKARNYTKGVIMLDDSFPQEYVGVETKNRERCLMFQTTNIII